MALQAWDKNYREQLKIQQQEIESLQQQLMIGADPLPHPSEDDRQRPNPNQKPSSPYLPGKSPHKLAGLRITPNTIMLPREPAPAESDDDYGEGDVQGHPDWKLSHGTHFDEYGQPIQDPTRGMDPSGNPITIPHLQQTPEEHERNKQLHIDKYHQAGATSRQIRDRLKPFTRGGSYDEQGGSLRGVPDALRIQLLRDAMAQNLPANNIRRLRDSGHKTDYTGGFRLGDDGKLHPVMGIIKADASNNIRRLNESGHQTVLDPVTNQLKIVRTMGPQAGLNLGGGRFLHNYEIKILRDAFQGASEKERNRLIEMYSDKPFKGLV